ncbi:hypothetical protein FZO89_03090 [Luteimonas viscosa]|uniref:Uncharacterized protein n=1 Tax=Luteimonas viscosa TaxID=1132694 RepID=A0A5D4XMZ8_9GAMM|nr:hypothetical protein [Luteimonas viscosa]TYT25335.1 hypothetical protein FZO89_03090 [Luteimonas viscosa]
MIVRNAGAMDATYAACVATTRSGATMHPILREMLTEPVGWLTIIGALIILGLPLFTALFIRRRMRADAKDAHDPP